jgi:hypothetical protein
MREVSVQEEVLVGEEEEGTGVVPEDECGRARSNT